MVISVADIVLAADQDEIVRLRQLKSIFRDPEQPGALLWAQMMFAFMQWLQDELGDTAVRQVVANHRRALRKPARAKAPTP
jgi:hypothetical protein